jgi:hypothetical protein
MTLLSSCASGFSLLVAFTLLTVSHVLITQLVIKISRKTPVRPGLMLFLTHGVMRRAGQPYSEYFDEQGRTIVGKGQIVAALIHRNTVKPVHASQFHGDQ